MQRMIGVWTLCAATAAAATVDFSDVSLAPNSFNNNAGGGDFVSFGAHFKNSFDSGFWSGWALTNQTNTSTTLPSGPPPANEYDPPYQYSAYNNPAGGSPNPAAPNYAVSDDFSPGDSTIVLPAGAQPVSVSLTNTLYGAISMLNGDGFAKQFAGPTVNGPGDWFLLTIKGLDGGGTPIAASPVNFYLADFRSANAGQDYILDHWTTVDLSSLAGAHALSFGLTSSDNGDFGMNTPATFALDNLVLAPVPEPSTLLLAALGAVGLAFWRQRRAMSAR